MLDKTCAKTFWQKDITKKWLKFNTTFKYPKTILEPTEYIYALRELLTHPLGDYVWKPNVGRKSNGVVLFSRTEQGYTLFPDPTVVEVSKTPLEVNKIVRTRIFEPKAVKEHARWFTEEWIHPHESLYCFTDDIRCPPILRLCGWPEIHFIGLSPMHEKSTGLSAAGWQDRKYIWLDLEGNVRSLAEMDLTTTDKHSIEIAHKKSLDNPPVGMKIEGVADVVKQINKEIASKITLSNHRAWSCDGVFDTNGDFVVIEMNHSPGLQFKGFKWKVA